VSQAIGIILLHGKIKERENRRAGERENTIAEINQSGELRLPYKMILFPLPAIIAIMV